MRTVRVRTRVLGHALLLVCRACCVRYRRCVPLMTRGRRAGAWRSRQCTAAGARAAAGGRGGGAGGWAATVAVRFRALLTPLRCAAGVRRLPLPLPDAVGPRVGVRPRPTWGAGPGAGFGPAPAAAGDAHAHAGRQQHGTCAEHCNRRASLLRADRCARVVVHASCACYRPRVSAAARQRTARCWRGATMCVRSWGCRSHPTPPHLRWWGMRCAAASCRQRKPALRPPARRTAMYLPCAAAGRTARYCWPATRPARGHRHRHTRRLARSSSCYRS